MGTWILRAALLLLSVITSAAPSPLQTTATEQVMRNKLAHTQHILEALMTSNFALLQQESDHLLQASQQPGWAVLNTPEYRRYTGAFVDAMQELIRSANERDLDAAAVHYAALTMTCYQCHRYVKNSRIVDVAPIALTSADNPPDAQARPRPPAPPRQRQLPSQPPQRAVPRPPAPAAPPSRVMPRVEIYPYPFWPPPGFPYRFPYGAYPPLWWWYPPYEYPLPPSAGTIEATGYGWVEFTVAPKGAAIVVDGYYVGVVDDFDGHQLMLVPGPHRIELQASGFTALTYNVNVERGRSIVLHSKLEPAQTTEK